MSNPEEADIDNKFNEAEVRAVVKKILSDKLLTASYDPATSDEVTTELTDKILNDIKALNYKGYKILVQLTLGELKGQGVKNVAKSFWDEKTDHVITETFQNIGLFCTVFVFGINAQYE
mmetsp:Transcript_8382/g.14488  ORF Transcript_8382/g.14488 Transcript_8382/m.14488 type:complete len:119 (+) Transcript_8382:52-408(+)